MQFIEFTENLKTGISQIDEQHEHLIGLINNLHDAMKRSDGSKILGETFEKLKAYTEYHFEFEETLFREFHYPDMENHIKEHNNLRLKVNIMREGFIMQNFESTSAALDFLKTWLFNHIMKTDMKYRDFLQKCMKN